MKHPIKAIDAIKCGDSEVLDVVEKYEVIDAMYGLDHIKLTDKDIQILKDGKYLYYIDGNYEYATIISYDGGKNEDSN